MAAVDAFAPDLPIYQHLGRTEAQRDWLARLPSLVASFERRWGVSTGSPFRAGTSSWAAPATTADGQAAVLKIAWPHPEAQEEGTGLLLWAGDGAVLAYQTDRADYALLLERCVPGTTLTDAELSTEDKLAAGAEVANRLWNQAPPAESTMDDMGTVTREWAVLMRERMAWHQPPFDRGLVAYAADLLAALPASAARRVVVHGDLNPGNVLAAQRHPWLAIDAKPMVGDPGYDPSPLLCQVDNPFTTADPPGEVRRRYALFAELVGEPVERLLGWTLARMVESALWLVDSHRPELGEAEMRDAAVVARVLGP